jgi:hypothetical protein
MVDMFVVNIEAAHDGGHSKVGEGGRDAGRSTHPAKSRLSSFAL